MHLCIRRVFYGNSPQCASHKDHKSMWGLGRAAWAIRQFFVRRLSVHMHATFIKEFTTTKHLELVGGSACDVRQFPPALDAWRFVVAESVQEIHPHPFVRAHIPRESNFAWQLINCRPLS